MFCIFKLPVSVCQYTASLQSNQLCTRYVTVDIARTLVIHCSEVSMWLSQYREGSWNSSKGGRRPVFLPVFPFIPRLAPAAARAQGAGTQPELGDITTPGLAAGCLHSVQIPSNPAPGIARFNLKAPAPRGSSCSTAPWSGIAALFQLHAAGTLQLRIDLEVASSESSRIAEAGSLRLLLRLPAC